MGGYQVRTEQLKVNTGQFISDLSSTADVARLNLDGLGRLSPVEAGHSISGSLTAVQAAWDTALPDVGKELTLLGNSVSASATMLEKVEVNVHDRFSRFAS